ncbi:TBC1 domain family member whacked [Gryllus bimaculatus]|nr:TBC1 domain family member whacked [Gryllus bimaculatus]
MDDLNDFSEHDGKASFWKKNSKAVPGRPSPKKDSRISRQRNTSCSTSFQDFQESVSDAWDIGDDEFCVISDVKISKRVAQSAALSVINSHRYTTSGEQVPSTVSPSPRGRNVSEEKEEVAKRLGSQSDLPVRSPSHAVSSLHSSSPLMTKQFPGRPQPLRPNQTKSKLFFPSLEGADCETSKLERFQPLLESSLLNLEELRQVSWSGIPVKVRAITWRLLSGYLPANLERRQPVLERKRLDYWNLVKQYYDTERDETHQDTYRQIHIDIPRMSPLIALFQQKVVQEMFERILFIWAIRHPASGYVQGINDLVTPFYVVFLQEVIPSECDLENWDVSSLPKEQKDIIEADSFWCLSKFLDGIQDNYIFAQLGIQHKVNQLKELIQRIDSPLHRHLQHHGVDYLQFSFRWMNNLLTRELPLHCTIRLWDTYLAESDGFAAFQLYVCAAFLLHWRRELLLERDFQGLMLMLQNLPTQNWTDSEIGILVAEAYRLKFTFADAPNHLQTGER